MAGPPGQAASDGRYPAWSGTGSAEENSRLELVVAMIHPLDGSHTPEEEAIAERAAILEFDAHLPRPEAERRARLEVQHATDAPLLVGTASQGSRYGR